MGLDLRDFYTGKLSPNKIMAMVRYLPPGSALVSEQRAAYLGGKVAEHRGWTVDTYMLAIIADFVRENTHSRAAMNTKKTVKAPPPVFRPGNARQEQTAKAKVLTISEIKRMQRTRGG